MKMKQIVVFGFFAARTITGSDPEKRKRCGTASRQDNTSRQSGSFPR